MANPPTAGPSGTSHTNEIPITEALHGQLDTASDEKEKTNTHVVDDIEMNDDVELIGDEAEPFLV